MINVETLNHGYSTVTFKPKKEKLAASLKKTMVPISLGSMLGMMPAFVYAAGADETFENIHRAAMNAFDGGTVLIIIFAGACWMLGHRSRAIELLLCASCGYLVARHAVDIRDFLKTI